jgi:hypothetical protein
MTWISDLALSIPWKDKVVIGEVSGCGAIWSFRSTDSDFLSLFHAGVLYSFNEFGKGALMANQRRFQQLVDEKVSGVFSTADIGNYRAQ